ncbi:hypothetical protein DSO57_1005446 [Entomophthora muscae]|uniref:Uncharacterized protein n=1 Tax=Entomophthora muscae TaxID=34485 RepID=A0ACC2SKL3_9FUNG|nr:hypothetical protein DSO57_1005446 [Entomophthora muscae]
MLETGPMAQSLTHEVEVLARRLATIPFFTPTSAATDNSPSSHLLGQDILELFDHYKKMQTELVHQSANLAFLFNGYHTVSDLQDSLKLCQSHDRANSQNQVRKDKEVIALLQDELATHEKRITSLEDDLDITSQENKVYQDELDEQQLLLDTFQSQLDRMDSKIMAVNLQAMPINSKSHHSPQCSSSPEFYHSYKSNDDNTRLAPNAVVTVQQSLLSI